MSLAVTIVIPSFEPAAASDVPALLPLLAALQREDAFEKPFDPLGAEAALRELIAAPAVGHVWKIVVDRQLAGYVVATALFSLELGGRCWLIDELYVVPPCRGGGVGTAALRFVVDGARDAGARTCLLEVSRDNDRAKRLYRSLEFCDRSYHLMKLELN